MSIVEKTKDNLDLCKCMECPSYTTGCKIKEFPKNTIDKIKGIENVEDFEGLFCAYKESDCINENKGCLCSGCDVHDKYYLENTNFCLEKGGF